jgi:hypothetical protein
VQRPENTSLLLPLFDLAAAVDDDGHFLAVFHRLDGRTFGGGFDVSDLRVACRLKLGYKFLLRQRAAVDGGVAKRTAAAECAAGTDRYRRAGEGQDPYTPAMIVFARWSLSSFFNNRGRGVWVPDRRSLCTLVRDDGDGVVAVIASEAKQSIAWRKRRNGLLRRKRSSQ